MRIAPRGARPPLAALLRLAALGVALAAPAPLAARQPMPGLVVPVPPPDSVRVETHAFASAGATRRFDVYTPRAAAGPLPVVIFVNAVTPALREWRGYQEWARLVTRRGVAAVLYESGGDASAADLRALLATLAERGASLRVAGDNVVLWAASANGAVGTPVALDRRATQVRGYVLYYGVGRDSAPRLDVPVLIARAGLDVAELNRDLDALAARLVAAGVPLTLVNHAAGRHGFDLVDATPATAAVIVQTLDFIAAATDPAVQRAVAAGTAEAAAAAALQGERWGDAVAGYRAVVAEHPTGPRWLQYGRALLGAGDHAAALAAFERVRDLGGAGPRDLGIPAARAALRAGRRDQAVEWVRWMLANGPPFIRPLVAGDPELGPLLDGARQDLR